MMLDEPEFSPAISAIEVLALWLVRLLAWFIGCLFGLTAKHVEHDVQMAEPLTVEEPSYSDRRHDGHDILSPRR